MGLAKTFVRIFAVVGKEITEVFRRPGAVLSLILGAHLGDLTGLSVGLLTAMLLEASLILSTVYEAIVSPRGSANLAMEEKP